MQTSNCCNKEVKVDCGSEGTCCYVCVGCGKPCDLKADLADTILLAKEFKNGYLAGLEKAKECLGNEWNDNQTDEEQELMIKIFGEVLDTPEYLKERMAGWNYCRTQTLENIDKEIKEI